MLLSCLWMFIKQRFRSPFMDYFGASIIKVSRPFTQLGASSKQCPYYGTESTTNALLRQIKEHFECSSHIYYLPRLIPRGGFLETLAVPIHCYQYVFLFGIGKTIHSIGVEICQQDI